MSFSARLQIQLQLQSFYLRYYFFLIVNDVLYDLYVNISRKIEREKLFSSEFSRISRLLTIFLARGSFVLALQLIPFSLFSSCFSLSIAGLCLSQILFVSCPISPISFLFKTVSVCQFMCQIKLAACLTVFSANRSYRIISCHVFSW